MMIEKETTYKLTLTEIEVIKLLHLLATIISDYLSSLSDNKLFELEDFLTNNFGDD